MFIWLKKDCNNTVGDVMVSFEPPETEEEDDWIMLTTREVHYEDIANQLDKQSKIYHAQNEHRAAMVSKDLAQELRRKISANPMVN